MQTHSPSSQSRVNLPSSVASTPGDSPLFRGACRHGIRFAGGLLAAAGLWSSALAAGPSPNGFLSLTSTDGKTISARIVEAIGQTITLQLADNRKFSVPLERLDLQSQKIVTAALLSQFQVTSVPEMNTAFLEPAIPGKPDEAFGTTFLRIGRSGPYWWARLHVGEFTPKPLDWRAVEFRHTGGLKHLIKIPERCTFEGSVKGGRRWRAQEFSISIEELQKLLPIIMDHRELSATAYTASGKTEEIKLNDLKFLGSSVALYLRAKAFSQEPDFTAMLPPVSDRSLDLLANCPPATGQSPFQPSAIPGGLAFGKVDRFSRGIVQTIEKSGDAKHWPLDKFPPQDRAELMTQLLETNYKFSQSLETKLEYFIPQNFPVWREARAITHLQLGRQIDSWRPLLWLTVPSTDPIGSALTRLRISIDDQPPFALTSVDPGAESSITLAGVTHHFTSFHANTLAAGPAENLVNARHIRFELMKDQESVWVEARPEEVEQIRCAVVQFLIMSGLHREGLKPRLLK